MGGAGSVNGYIDQYEETIDDIKLTTSERESLTKLAENIFEGAEDPRDIRRRVNDSIDRENVDTENVHGKAFLKYLAVEVMKAITKQAMEDAMASLLHDFAEKVDEGKSEHEVGHKK